MTDVPIQILGAGLTGMSAAHHLNLPYQIHEKLGHVGGHAITLQEKGYRFDRTGHLLHLRDPEIRSWVLELLGDDVVEVQRSSKVFSHGVYTRYPYQANTFGLPPKVAYECLTGFIAALTASEKPSPANFEEFCLQHFGEGFSKNFMVPYNEKLWGVHPREITADWCSRFVPLPKLEDVIAGAVGMNDRELGYNANFLYPSLGIGELPTALARDIADHIVLNHGPKAIDWRKKRLIFSDAEIAYDALICTAPLDKLVAMMTDVPADIADAARKLRCNPLWYLDVALDAPCGVDLHWAYVPEERFPFYRVGCYSNFSAKMAPPGKACLYVELASRAEPNMQAVLPQVAQGLMEMQLIQRPEDIAFAVPRFIEHAYVVFDHNYYPALEVIKPFLHEQAIIPAGRYGDWNYSSMGDALNFGRSAARAAEELYQ